ncbi:MAG: O-antigen ligase family protein [Dethiobacteria bacterium]
MVKKRLNFEIPVLMTMLVLYPLIFTPYVMPRWTAFMVISLLALIVVCKEKIFFYNHSLIPLNLFLLFVFASALFSPYSREAWLGDAGYMTGFIAYFFFAVLFILAYSVALRNPAEIENMLNLWLWSAALIAFIGLLQYIGLNLLPFGGRDIFKPINSSSTICNSNDLGTFLAMAFPFAARRFLQKPDFSGVLIFGLIYGSLLTTFCRGAWLGVAGGILLIAFYFPQKKNLLVMFLAILLITAFLAPLHNWKLTGRMGTFRGEAEAALAGDPRGGSGRLLLWQEGWKALPQSLLTGSGPDTFYYVSPQKFAERFGEGARAPRKAHNIFLEIAVTMGIPALLFYLWFLWSICAQTERNNSLQFSFLVMVAIYLVRGFFLVDVLTVYPLFWVLLGFYQGLKTPKAVV